jgi:exopolysaccharide biosynthesis polyprenyl glycosylphosphotransferase
MSTSSHPDPGGTVAEVGERLHVASPTVETPVSERPRGHIRRRGWVVRRALLVADLVGLIVAFAIAESTMSGPGGPQLEAWALLPAILPVWVVMARLYGLYDRDEERPAHSGVDDVVGVFHLVTVGVWALLLEDRLTGTVETSFDKVAGLWLLAILLITAARAVARAAVRRSSAAYVQRVVIVGAGDVGQLVARKLLQHPEYGIDLVGFVDASPRELRPELSEFGLVGRLGDLRSIVEEFDVDRLVIAFSHEPEAAMVDLIRSLRDLDVQIDVVPRLFEIIGPKICNHSIEALPLIGLPPVRMSRSSRAVKRMIDVVGASLALVLTAPLFVVIAVLIRRDSAGPVFFRQARLGLGMREFAMVKFRTMRVDADDSAHREYIRETMSATATVGENGLYKLERNEVTQVGRWLRRLSLDELPQLINVLRGDMSLVGPRPCIRYETQYFKPYQFERFLVPAGLTGLWQVTARAHSTFGESLDMDVAYARGWSLGLDLRLLCQTPLETLRQRGTT